MTTGGRSRRDSSTGSGVIKKAAYVNSGKTRATTNRPRLATFVQGDDLSKGSSAKKLSGTQNAVTQTKLRSDRTPVEGADRTVFFKAHDNTDAASQYAVASTRLARFLGMPNVIARNAFADIKGNSGVVAWRVPGVPLVSSEFKNERTVDKGMSQAEIDDWVKGAQLVKRGGKLYGRSASVQQYVDYTDPRIQKGMSDLQLFDALSGQLDRHGGNIYVDPATGTVTGIDDDKSFGNGKAVSEIAERDPRATHYRGLPEQVDEATALRILSKDPQDLWEELAERVKDGRSLSTAVINDARLRLIAVQSYLTELRNDDKLVKVWNDQTYQKTMQYPNRSYLGVAAESLASAFEGHVDNPGQYNEVRYKVAGAPKTVPPLPARLPAWTTTQRPGQQARQGQNLLGQARNAPPQPSQPSPTSARAMAVSRMRERINRLDPVAPRRQQPPGNTTITMPDDPTDLPAERVDTLSEIDEGTGSFGGRRLVRLSGDDEVFMDDDRDMPPDVLTEVDRLFDEVTVSDDDFVSDQ